MISRKDYFCNLKPLNFKHGVEIANKVIIETFGIGTITIEENLNGNIIRCELKDVLYAPDLKRNLFSVGRLTDQNFSFHAYKKQCEICDSYGKISSRGVRKNGLFYFPFRVLKSKSKVH